MANWAFWSVQILPAGRRFPELDTDDVLTRLSWSNSASRRPDPAVPLSALGLSLGIEFEPGDTAKSITIPTRSRRHRRTAEGVVLLLEAFGDPVVPQPIEMTGRMSANP